MSSYFIGFTIGSATSGRIIQRIGHIRSYAAFAGIVICASAVMTIYLYPYAWAVLRAVIGFGCVGLFVTTESWLNAKATASSRGRVFSTYMVGTFLALALGQLLVGRFPLDSAVPFNVILALFALALVIVSMTRAAPPPIAREKELPYGELTRTAPLATSAAAISGMVSATLYAVVPGWMLASEIAQDTIGLVMLCVVLGGLAFQVPVGTLSDRMDRRVLLCLLAIGFASSAIALVALPRTLTFVLPTAALLGGFMSTLYPVCVSYAMDKMSDERVVSISGRLIFISGIGAMIGPFTGSWIMTHLDIDGVLFFIAGAAAVLAIVAGMTASARPATPGFEAPFVVVAPQAVQVAPEPIPPPQELQKHPA